MKHYPQLIIEQMIANWLVTIFGFILWLTIEPDLNLSLEVSYFVQIQNNY